MSLRMKKMERKKHEIVRSAAEVLCRKGYHGTTLEEIAANLLMTKGSIYYYFKNKEELLYECHKIILNASLERIESILQSNKSPLEKLREAIVAHVDLAINEKSMFAVIDKPEQTFSGEHLEEIINKRSCYAKCFDRIIYEGIEQGAFISVDVKMVRMILLGALNWIQQWYSPDGGKTAAEIEEKFSTYLLRMLMPEGGTAQPL